VLSGLVSWRTGRSCGGRPTCWRRAGLAWFWFT
jgi:hypothetical protein